MTAAPSQAMPGPQGSDGATPLWPFPQTTGMAIIRKTPFHLAEWSWIGCGTWRSSFRWPTTAVSPAAARALGLSPPAATRAVANLEARLGLRLLVRTTRSLRLTEAGARFLGDCRRLLGRPGRGGRGGGGQPCGPARPGGRVDRAGAVSGRNVRSRRSSAPFSTATRGSRARSLFLDRGGRPESGTKGWTGRSGSGTCRRSNA